jgi:hypothetical protein
MANLLVCLPAAVRPLAVLAAAVPLLLPLPARSAACPATVGRDCPHCAAAGARHSISSTSACCQHRAASRHESADDDSIHSVSNHLPRCGCTITPIHRTVPTTDRLLLPLDLAADLPYLAVTSGSPPRCLPLATAPENLPPAIPHRILHCCWLI